MTTKRQAHCQVLLERLSAYLDGDLSAASCRAIERHAEGCPRCTELIADLRRTVGLCQRAANTPLPATVRARARSRIRALMARKT
jgi:anti-sigma factor (TIGR02949 family)